MPSTDQEFLARLLLGDQRAQELAADPTLAVPWAEVEQELQALLSLHHQAMLEIEQDPSQLVTDEELERDILAKPNP